MKTNPSFKIFKLSSLEFLFVLTAVAALSVAYPAKANLVTNGGFETGDFTGWSLFGPQADGFVGGTTDGIAPHSGSFQALLGAPPTGFEDSVYAPTQSIPTVPGQSDTISFWLASSLSINGGPPPEGLVAFFWQGTFQHPLVLTNLSAFGYTHYTFNLTTDLTSTGLQFTFDITHRFGPTGHLFLDDVSVTPTTVPDAGSTFPLLGFALLGLTAFRRKLRC